MSALATACGFLGLLLLAVVVLVCVIDGVAGKLARILRAAAQYLDRIHRADAPAASAYVPCPHVPGPNEVGCTCRNCFGYGGHPCPSCATEQPPAASVPSYTDAYLEGLVTGQRKGYAEGLADSARALRAAKSNG